MAVTQIDGSRQVKDASVTNAKLAGSIALTKLEKAVLAADGTQALTGNLGAGGFKITGLADPALAADAATKSYVDARIQGLDTRKSVRVATTAALPAYTHAAGVLTAGTSAAFPAQDGVTVALNESVFVKNETGTNEPFNGVYVLTDAGSATTPWKLTRRDDLDSSAEMSPNVYFFIEEGTALHDTGWTLATNGPITLGTTALTFTQFNGAGTVDAGAGSIKNGSAIDVVSANAAIVVNVDNLALTLGTTSGLEVHTSGLRLARGTAGQIIVVNGTGDPVYAAMSGDATIADTGAVTVASTITRNAAFVTRETPGGAIDGTNATFTLANVPVLGSEEVFLNGILQEPGTGNDYTISGATITWLTPVPVAGDKIRVSYRK